MEDNAAEPIDTEHYLRAVADLGDKRVVMAEGAIYSASGIKLVEKGVPIDSRLYERLVQHKLREPIDSQLTVEGAVDAAGLQAAARALLADAPLPRLLASGLKSPDVLAAPLGRLRLPRPMAFKLTLMREQQPDLFQHSLEMTLVALFLGMRSELRPEVLDAVASAALLHDIGMLHMHPAWRDPQYRLTGLERTHLVAHPITSMLMVRNCQSYPREVETAVLEHHERHDGSGYPRGLQGAAISPLGKILLLAVVVAALFHKHKRAPAQKLSLVLRLKHRMFDATLVGYLMPLLREDALRQSVNRPAALVYQYGELLASAVEKWSALKMTIPATEFADGANGPARLLDSRLQALVRSLTEAGNQPGGHAQLVQSLGDDAEGLAELGLIGREALWELQSIVNACQRRWPDLADNPRAGSGDEAVAEWCEWMQDQLPPMQQASIVQPL
ncbi:MAG TPA: HD domain-containing phosphohydrolase [Burkholderiaceae bacterium]|nr:HD domain-containing phosphohydrolase [Burkholderiaceae bacterium]